MKKNKFLFLFLGIFLLPFFSNADTISNCIKSGENYDVAGTLGSFTGATIGSLGTISNGISGNTAGFTGLTDYTWSEGGNYTSNADVALTHTINHAGDVVITSLQNGNSYQDCITHKMNNDPLITLSVDRTKFYITLQGGALNYAQINNFDYTIGLSISQINSYYWEFDNVATPLSDDNYMIVWQMAGEYDTLPPTPIYIRDGKFYLSLLELNSSGGSTSIPMSTIILNYAILFFLVSGSVIWIIKKLS